MNIKLVLVSTLLAGAAHATECGEARLAYAHYKAAAQVEQDEHHAGPAHDARAALEGAERKLRSACVPRKVGIVALPLAYASVAPGNASTTKLEPADGWKLVLSTGAGAPNGIVFAEPAELSLPPIALSADKGPELYVAFASDAQLTVEEPEAGQGSWRIEAKTVATAPMSAIRACAAGKGDAGHKLDKASCQMLLRVDPLAGPSALPEPGRAVFVGEWQFGWHAGLELGDVELSGTAPVAQPAHLELPLSLTAPIPGVSDGKKLTVTVETNPQARPAGAVVKLAHECGNDDDKCQKESFDVGVWYDRAFGVPLVRVRPVGAAKAQATGKIADRLARPMVGQRVMLVEGARKIVTISDDLGDYHFDDLAAGEATVFPVGKKPADRPGKEESHKVMIGLGEAKVPILYVTKLFE